VIQLFYTSLARTPFTAAQLETLLEKARAVNVGLEVTGMLLHQDGAFLQVLEGEVAAVGTLYDKISRDRRHDRVLMLARQEVAARSFPDWSMGFSDVRGSAAKLIGFRHIGDLAGVSGDLRAIEMVLRNFRDGRWAHRAA
jgi:hypothetical protein